MRQTVEDVNRQYHRMDRRRGEETDRGRSRQTISQNEQEERRQTEEDVSRQYHRMDRGRGD
jgi:hypothetical protein